MGEIRRASDVGSVAIQDWGRIGRLMIGAILVVVVAALLVTGTGEFGATALGLSATGGLFGLAALPRLGGGTEETGPTDAVELLEDEIHRARRFGQEVSVLAAIPAASTSTRRLRNQIRGQVRLSDRLIVDRGTGLVVVVCPATGPSDAARVAKRLGDDLVGGFDEVGVASFPVDSLTAPDLLAAATSRVQPVEI